jgi:hypothetical protein
MLNAYPALENLPLSRTRLAFLEISVKLARMTWHLLVVRHLSQTRRFYWKYLNTYEA